MSAAAVSAAGEPLNLHAAGNRELVTTLWDGWAVRSVPGGIAAARRWLAIGMWHVQVTREGISLLAFAWRRPADGLLLSRPGSAERWLGIGSLPEELDAAGARCPPLDELEELVRLVFERDLAYVGNRIVANRGARIPPERH